MRVLQSGIYHNFIQDQADAKSEIDRLTTQISSGKKIEHSYEDSSVYIDTLRLDSEINVLKGVQNRTEKSKVITDASDLAMNEIDLTMIDIKTKLIQASSDTLTAANRESIAQELEQSKEHLMTLANSTVNGQYLFSGSAVNVQPIDNNGDYHGNDKVLKTLIGENREVPYSIDGASLFFGFDNSIHKSVSSNVHLQNQNTNETLKKSDKVEDLLGGAGNGYFYLSGVKHDGDAFKEKITLSSNDTIASLLSSIENVYGNDTIKAELTNDGTIMIEDTKVGNSKLDFQMVASLEDVTDLSALNTKIEFNKSAHNSNDDKANFNKNGNILSGNVPLLSGDGFASNATKLSEIANQSLDGKTFTMNITDIDGNAQNVSLNLSANSTFSIGGYSYDIYDADDSAGATKTTADNLTLGQLNNVIAMVMAHKLPATTNSKSDFDAATVEAKKLVSVGLDSAGALKIEDKSNQNKNISFSFYDKDTSDFTKSASLSFMGNRAVVVNNPKIDFFKDLDTIIEAVREGITGIDANGANPANPGMQNAIAKIDNLSTHFAKEHTKIGAMSNNLQLANDKASTLELNVTQLKSKVADVDIAEAITQYQQVSLNYQAMMSTVSKVNSLTLLNYLK